MGTFYRSRHELIFAFKNGTASHINSFELGQHGRYRTNVWAYKGANTLRRGRMEELALHPTVKPVQLIADAIKDVSGGGDIVLALFGGSGATLIAAHKTGRRAYLCELDPIYCDRMIRRWEAYAKDDAEQIACGLNREGRRCAVDHSAQHVVSHSVRPKRMLQARRRARPEVHHRGLVVRIEGREQRAGERDEHHEADKAKTEHAGRVPPETVPALAPHAGRA